MNLAPRGIVMYLRDRLAGCRKMAAGCLTPGLPGRILRRSAVGLERGGSIGSRLLNPS